LSYPRLSLLVFDDPKIIFSPRQVYDLPDLPSLNQEPARLTAGRSAD